MLLCDARGLAPYVSSLRALERGITYPIDDGRDRFFIDHGADYHPFFSGLGDPKFLLALHGDEVVGAVAGVFRDAREATGLTPSVYLCDLKVAPSQRGAGLARRMAARALKLALSDRSLWRWRLAYGAAMRDARGDVTRSMRGAHPGRLLRANSSLAVFFCPATSLASLDVRGCPRPPDAPGLELSPRSLDAVTSTAGRKDLRLRSTDAPWPLVHLPRGPSEWSPSLGHYLRACGESLCAAGRSGDTACFALDERLRDQLAWLALSGITPGAACAVYTLRLGRAPESRWTHLSTAEI